jgi:hypothetical protein
MSKFVGSVIQRLPSAPVVSHIGKGFEPGNGNCSTTPVPLMAPIWLEPPSANHTRPSGILWMGGSLAGEHGFLGWLFSRRSGCEEGTVSQAEGETRNNSGTASVAVPRRHSSKRSALSGASGPTYTVRAPAWRAVAAKPAAG